MKGDELYPTGFPEKAQYKLANLMKHGYLITEHTDSGIRIVKGTDDLIIMPNAEVFKKVIY